MTEKAQVGDLIRIVNVATAGEYNVGEIYEVKQRGGRDIGVYLTTNWSDMPDSPIYLYDYEYVIHRKAGEEDEEKPCEGSTSVQEQYTEILERRKQASENAVSHPSHYTQGRFETIEIIEEITQGYSDGYVAYCVGNALKYLARAPFKHESPAEDIAKARAYLDFAIKRLG